jgi:hypothetical protein
MSLVVEAPHLLIIPVLLDIYLLLGLKISASELTARLGAWFGGRGGDGSHDVGRWISDQKDWDLTRAGALLTPSVIDGLPQSKIYEPIDRLTWSPAPLVASLLITVLILAGTAIFTGYIVMLADRADLIRTQQAPILSVLRDRWVKLVGFGTILVSAIAVIAAVAIAPGMLVDGRGMSAENVVALVSLAAFPLLVVTMFVPESIVIDGSGPIEAIRAGASVVVHSFWQSAGFFAVSLMISPGLLSIWERIAGDPVGLGLAIVLNAAMVTSLSLASLAFYRARFDGAAHMHHRA